MQPSRLAAVVTNHMRKRYRCCQRGGCTAVGDNRNRHLSEIAVRPKMASVGGQTGSILQTSTLSPSWNSVARSRNQTQPSGRCRRRHPAPAQSGLCRFRSKRHILGKWQASVATGLCQVPGPASVYWTRLYPTPADSSRHSRKVCAAQACQRCRRTLRLNAKSLSDTPPHKNRIPRARVWHACLLDSLRSCPPQLLLPH